MAPNDSAQTTEEAKDLVAGRRRATRYIVPVAVAGVAAATIGLVPALAASGDPDLPKITAQELIEKMAASDTQQLSGTVKINTDLGIPSLGGLADLGGGSLAPGGEGGKSGSAASPDGKLLELASGSHTLRVAADGPDKQKVSILEDTAEYSVIHNSGEVWAYDSASNEAFHAKDDGSGTGPGKEREAAPKDLPTTPKELADEALKAADETTSVTVGGTAQVAGRDAYQLVIKPKQSGSTVGSIKIAVDAKNGVPLKFTLTPSSGGKAAIDAGFTKVDFSKPAASTFDFTPPKGAKVTEADELEKEKGQERGAKNHEDFKGMEDFQGLNIIGEGWTSIAKIEMPGGEGIGAPKDGEVPPEAEKFLNALGDQVDGKFGSGTVFKTRLVNALMTDDGKVYVGAVTKDALVKAANEGK
ncbi:outer membrane lipoprotein carrier protein LolA [Streptomyces maoxianensis]|uniref:Outer membrane lipoprotein carrier protein LolA n=1 Tax=Streptomyces maoxianensis TaxID=1459942 RepID=A0ABV9G182_9ACTN